MFNKTNVAMALAGAANAGAFTANQASGFGAARSLHEKRAEFTNADIPKISALFGMFDANNDSVIEPKEVYAVYESNTDEAKPDNKKNFMKKMDSGMRTFCGVPQKEAEATEIATEAGANVEKLSAAKPKNRRSNWKKKMGKKMKKMMKRKGNMFGIFGVMKMAMLFKPFSSADENGDMKVTPLEMGAFMNKKAKKICKKYKKMERKAIFKKWFEMGVPAAELAKMKAKKEEKKAEMKKKWGSWKKGMKDMKKKWNDKKGEMKKKWNDKKNKRKGGKRGGRRGDRGRGGRGRN